MAKISTYIIDSTPQLTDKVIGTDVTDNNITKNYLIGDIVALVPSPTLSPTKMFYGDAASLAAETSTLTYIVGGSGIVAEDTVVMSGTLLADVCSINSVTSVLVGKRVLSQQSGIANSVAIGQDICDSGANNCVDNVLIGKEMLSAAADSFTKNVLIGSKVLNQSSQQIDSNTVIGYEAGQALDVPLSDNIFIGPESAKLGGLSGQGLTTNIAIGKQAAFNLGNSGNNAPTNNIAIGTNAGKANSGNNNISIGTNSGVAANLGFFNVGLGANALTSQVGGDFNVAIGNDALEQLQTGTTNTAVGKAAGSTVVGFTNTTNLGHNSQAQADNEVVLGDNNVTTLRCNTQIIQGLSDLRDKDNIEELSLGLEFIMDLDPVTWDWDRRDGSMKGKKDSGFVAQEIDEVVEDWEAEEILPSLLNKNNPDAWEVGNAALIPVLVKAIQELKKELDACKAEK